MVRVRASIATLVVTLVGAGALIAPAPTASASASGAAAAGVCSTANGTTVVVDMSALGGDIVVRCAKGSGFSGLDALKKAGFSVTGTAQSGLAYVCRIQGRPSATETLPVKGKPDYKEACRVTPPTSAYWSYWYAKDGGAWTYASTGASGHAAIRGGFEGWTFSLNRGGNPPRPAFTPTRPKAPAPPSPTSSAPSSQPTQPDQTNDGGSGGGTDSQPGDSSGSKGTSPTDGPSSATGGGGKGDKSQGSKGDGAKGDKKSTGPTEPTATDDESVTTAGGEAEVTGELPADPTAADAEDSGGSSTATLVGIGLLVLLGGGAGITAWRRSHRG